MATTTSINDKAPVMKGLMANPETARWFALGAVAGPILFTLAWVVLGMVSPGFSIFGTWVSPYSPIAQPISGLGLGSTGPYMNTAFVLSAVLIFAGVVGIFQSIRELGAAARRTCIVLLALCPLGMAMDGIFTLESIMLHLLGYLLGNGSIVASFIVIGLALRRIPGWRQFGSWLLVGSPLTLVLLVVSLATFDPETSGMGLGVGGLTERILLVEVMAWLVALGWLAFRQPSVQRSAH